MSGRNGLFLSSAYPLRSVVDPTGAGDSFVGGMMGYLSTARGSVDANLRKAMVYGSVVALDGEASGLNTTTRISRKAIDARFKELAKLTQF